MSFYRLVTMLLGHIFEIFAAFLKLGLTSFGGPVAHLGYFHREFVVRRRWLSEEAYGELVGLGQFLPGPASSQVGFAIGLARGGWWGGIAAWTAFTLPSALAMLVFAYAVDRLSGPLAAHVLHGLKLVAIPIVAQALIDMTGKLAPDRPRRLLAMAATFLMLAMKAPAMQFLTILMGGLFGIWLCRDRAKVADHTEDGAQVSAAASYACLSSWGSLLACPSRHHGLRGWLWRISFIGRGHWSLVAVMSSCPCCGPRSCRGG
jgi:chromate transporter